MTELLLYTPFGPDKDWNYDLWKEAVRRLELPKQTKLFLIDNTGMGGKVADRLFSFLVGQGLWSHTTIWSTQERVLNHNKLGIVFAKWWPTLLAQGSSEYLLSLEWDVTPKQGTYSALRKQLEETANTEDQIDFATVPLHSRFRPDVVMAYTIDAALSGRSHFVPIKKAGTSPINTCHLGCTLYRRSVLKLLALHIRTPIALEKIASRGFEFVLHRYMMFWNWSEGRILWDYPARHHITAKDWV